MTLRFNKVSRADGVDGHFLPDDKRVTVKPSEFPDPIYPEDAGFWDQFTDTLHAVCMAHDRARMTRGVSPALEPVINSSAVKAAELVHKDMMSDIMLIGFKAIRIKQWRGFTGLGGKFTDRAVLLNHLMGWAAHAVSANSFCAKWEFMMPRPEEVAGALARGEMDAPDDVMLQLSDAFDLKSLGADQTIFTAYPEGCPGHPSYNAMHSAAASACAAVIKAMMQLDDTDTAQIDLTARNMAHFRSVAGVHYPADNSVGLWLGQETVRRLLPAKMLAEFGVPVAQTVAALEATHFDWLG